MSKASLLSSKRFKTKNRWYFCIPLLLEATTGFCAENILPKILEISQSSFQDDGQAEYSQFQDHALQLLWPAQCSLSRFDESGSTIYEWSLSKTSSVFRANHSKTNRQNTFIQSLYSAYRCSERHSKVIWWLDSVLDPTWPMWSWHTRKCQMRTAMLFVILSSWYLVGDSCSSARQIAWVTCNTNLMKKSSIGMIRGSVQKMTSFFSDGFVHCPKHGEGSAYQCAIVWRINL